MVPVRYLKKCKDNQPNALQLAGSLSPNKCNWGIKNIKCFRWNAIGMQITYV